MIIAKYPHWLIAALIVVVVIISSVAAVVITITIKDISAGQATPRDLLILVGSLAFVIGFGVGLIFAESAQSKDDNSDYYRTYMDKYSQMICDFTTGEIDRDELFERYTND